MSEIAERTETLPASSPMDAIMQYAMSGNAVDMDVMRGLMDMRNEMEAEEAKKAYAAAMSRAQASMPLIRKDAKGNNNNKYGSRQEIIRTIRPIYTAEGLSVSFDQEPSPTQGMVRHLAIVSHELGHREVFHLDLPADTSGNKNAVQAHGSATVYAIRYLLADVFLLGFDDDPDDDDGNSAAQRGPDLLEYNLHCKEHWDLIQSIKEAVANEDDPLLVDIICDQAREDNAAGLVNEQRTLSRIVRVAPTKGGLFTVEEKRKLISDEIAAAVREAMK